MLFSQTVFVPKGAKFVTTTGRIVYLDNKSLNCFSGDSALRKKLVNLISWHWFDKFIIFIIVANSILVGLHNYSYRIYDEENQEQELESIKEFNQKLDRYEYFLSAIFFFECAIKIIGQGFFKHQNAYLRSNWNKLDFLVILILIIEMSPIDMEKLSILKIFRMFRLLRPLRSIQKIPRVRLLVTTLIQSFRGLVDVIGFMVFICSVFAILGIHQFLGAQYRRCRMTAEPIIDELEPLNSVWPINFDAITLCRTDSMCQQILEGTDSDVFKCGSPKDYDLPREIDNVRDQGMIQYDIVGFENYGKAMITIFQAITLEGWINMTYNYSDSESPIISPIFFGTLVIFCSFFALNLVLAQILDSFQKQLTADSPANLILQADLIDKFSREEFVDKTAEIKPTVKKDLPPLITGVRSEISESQSEMEDVFKLPPIQKTQKTKNQKNFLLRLDSEAEKVHSHMVSDIAQSDQSEIISEQDDSSENKSSQSQTLSSSLEGLQKQREALQSNLLDKKNDKRTFGQLYVLYAKLKEITSQIEFLKPLPSEETEQRIQSWDTIKPLSKITPQRADQQQESQEKCSCKALVYKLVTHPFFNFLIFMLIIGNMILLTMDDHYTSKKKAKILNDMNTYLSYVFFVEMVLKMIGLGPKNYLKDSYNQFDAFVVLCSIVEVILSYTVSQTEDSSTNIFVPFKCLRLLRVLKLLRNWKALNSILQKLLKSTMDMGYFSILVLLFMYIVALLGTEQFAYSCFLDLDGESVKFDALEEQLQIQNQLLAQGKSPILEAPRLNFDSIAQATITVFVLLIAEDWPGVMYNYVHANESDFVEIYFIGILIVGNMILLSLFTTVLLQNFGDLDEIYSQENAIASDSLPKISCMQSPVKYFKVKTEWLKHYIKLQFMQSFATSEVAAETQKVFTLYLEAQKEANEVQKSDDSKEKEVDKEIEKSQNSAILTDNNLLKESEFSQKSVLLTEEESQQDKEDKDNQKFQETTLNNLDTIDNLDQQQRENTFEEDQHKFRRMSTRIIDSNRKIRREKSLKESPKKIKRASTTQEFHLQKYSTFIEQTQSQQQELLSRMTGKTLNCFDRDSKLRIKLFTLINKQWFDQVILVFILVSTILLAFENPLQDKDTQMVKVLFYIDVGMTTVFLSEMMIKIIAVGFVCNGSDSYLQNAWNVLDFMIVLVSLLSIMFSHLDLSFLKAIRMMRILRPLRLIQRNKSLKIAVTSLINSMPNISLLQVNLFFFMFMMGILCTTLFGGQFYSCQIDHISIYNGEGLFQLHEVANIILTKNECLDMGGEWVNQDHNFDTINESMLTLVAIQSTEGWIDVMWSSVDSNKTNYSPIKNNKPAIILLYFFLVFVLCLLFLNLFVGIVIDTFNFEKERLMKNGLLQEFNRRWINTQIRIFDTKPLFKLREQKQFTCLTNLLIKLVTLPCFDIFVTSCIVINTIILAIQYYGISDGLKNAFQICNYVFMVIFTFEAIFKLIAMGKAYFRDSWNTFDFVIVVMSLIVLGISQIPNLGLDLSTQMTIGRILRILRVIKLIKRAQNLQLLFETLAESLSAIVSLGTLLLMFTFLFSILGNSMFSFIQLDGQNSLDHHANFQSFSNSFLLLLRSATGEGWNNLMFDTGRRRSILFQCDPRANYESIMLNDGVPNGCGSNLGYVYFIVFQIIVSQIFLNLFIAIVVDTYIIQKQHQSRVIKDIDIETFQKVWQNFDPAAKGLIAKEKLEFFILRLSQADTSFFPYNQEQLKDDAIRESYIAFLQIPLHGGYKYYIFTDVLFLVAKFGVETGNFKKILDQEHAIKNLRTNIKIDSIWRFGITLRPEQIETKVNELICLKVNELIYKDYDQKKCAKALVVQEQKELVFKISKDTGKTLDKFIDHDGTEVIYTSEHDYAASFIQKTLRLELQKNKPKQMLLTPSASMRSPDGITPSVNSKKAFEYWGKKLQNK